MRALLTTLSFLARAHEVNVDVDKNRPVARVVQLLNEMKTTIEKEQKQDEEIYEKLACWCKTNDREKTQSIRDAETAIAQLTSKIESLTAQSSRLNTEINDLNKEISENEQALDQAAALRAKQLEEFTAEEKDMVQAITSLKAAIVVLSKHHSQLQEGSLLNVAAFLKEHLDRRDVAMTAKEKRKIQNFIQAPSYDSQSGEIFGILKNMLETFQHNLESSQKEEVENAKAFEELKAAKMSEIKAGKQQADKKSEEKANAVDSRAQAKRSLEDTRNSLSADEQFLMALKEKCVMTDNEWAARQKARQQEVVAISQAISVLASDDARDNFSRTYNFIQVDDKFTRGTVALMLSSVASKYHNPRIASISTSVRLDAFTKVKAAIDQMIEQLLVEKKDEVKHKDWCVDSLNTNQSNREKTERDRQDEEGRIDHLRTSIAALTSLIDKLSSEISELQVQLKRAGEDRERQNAEFQTVLVDQRNAQEALTKAKGFLTDFYQKQEKGTGFLQVTDDPAGPPPPKGFDAHKKNEGGNSVIMLLEQILADTKAMEAELVHDEEENQKGYESFVKETNRSLSAKSDQKVDTAADRAGAEQELSEAESSHAGLMKELEQLSNHNADIHKSCDFVLKNFDIRQQGRDEEVEALRQAKSILSGANFQKFLQKI